jgi:hypothetical protein
VLTLHDFEFLDAAPLLFRNVNVSLGIDTNSVWRYELADVAAGPKPKA